MKITIADIAIQKLLDSSRKGFVSSDVRFLKEVFRSAVNRRVMKKDDTNWRGRVMQGLITSERFNRVKSGKFHVYNIKMNKDGTIWRE